MNLIFKMTGRYNSTKELIKIKNLKVKTHYGKIMVGRILFNVTKNKVGKIQ